MDLYCSRCGEPWEIDFVTQEMTQEERDHFNAGLGCPACNGKPVDGRPFRANAAAVLRDVLGDDLDGAAAEMEDLEASLGSSFWD